MLPVRGATASTTLGIIMAKKMAAKWVGASPSYMSPTEQPFLRGSVSQCADGSNTITLASEALHILCVV